MKADRCALADHTADRVHSANRFMPPSSNRIRVHGLRNAELTKSLFISSSDLWISFQSST